MVPQASAGSVWVFHVCVILAEGFNGLEGCIMSSLYTPHTFLGTVQLLQSLLKQYIGILVLTHIVA